MFNNIPNEILFFSDMDHVSDTDSQMTDFDTFLQNVKEENTPSPPSQATDDAGGLPFTMNDCNPDITHQSTKVRNSEDSLKYYKTYQVLKITNLSYIAGDRFIVCS